MGKQASKHQVPNIHKLHYTTVRTYWLLCTQGIFYACRKEGDCSSSFFSAIAVGGGSLCCKEERRTNSVPRKRAFTFSIPLPLAFPRFKSMVENEIPAQPCV